MKPSSLAAAVGVVWLSSVPVHGQAFSVAEKETMVTAHNQVRCGVSPTAQTMPPVVWDGALEATAQAWADGCRDIDVPFGLIDHNPNRSDGHPYYVGENIFASGGVTASPGPAVTAWAAESANYNYAANTCSGVCGHYTQLVWANSRRIGCARSYCGALTYPSSIVCNYGPGGNVGGPPYTQGSGLTGACDLLFQDGFEM
jgi:uncharacterized protein YkwD